MKILTYLLLSMMAGLTGMDRITSRVQTKDLYRQSDSIDTTETSYTVNLLVVDSSLKYFHDIMPVLDTLVKNDYAQMYCWAIRYSGDSLFTAIQNWSFTHFTTRFLRNKSIKDIVHGAFRYSYGNNSRIFFILKTEGQERENEFLNKTFHMTDSLLEVEVKYEMLPPNAYFGTWDIMTIFRFIFADNHICDDMYFTYNSNLISLKPDSVNGLTVTHSDPDPRWRLPKLRIPVSSGGTISDSITRQTDSLSK